MRLKKSTGRCPPTRPIPKSAGSNQHTAGKPLRISSDFAHVTAEAVRLNRLTHGALDVTVGPLVNLWGFGPDKSVTREPSPEQIKQAASYTGIDKIILQQGKDYASLSKTHPKAYLDLSSIAKGFGVDKVAGELENTAFKIIWSKSAASCTAKAKMRTANRGASV